jgi:hypothetical protein
MIPPMADPEVPFRDTELAGSGVRGDHDDRLFDTEIAPRTRIVAAGFDTWARSPFVQARLALFGKTVFLLSFGFFVIMNLAFVLGKRGSGRSPSPSPGRPNGRSAGGATTRRARRPRVPSPTSSFRKKLVRVPTFATRAADLGRRLRSRSTFGLKNIEAAKDQPTRRTTP